MTTADFSAHELARLEGVALEVAGQVAQLGMSFFRGDVAVETKRDRSLVSQADRAIEMRARALLAERTPQWGFLGEEFGRLKRLSDHDACPFSHDPNPEGFHVSQGLKEFEKGINMSVAEPLVLNEDTYWMLDPIDGTVNFLARSPLWSTLIALIHKGEPLLGLVALPGLDEVFVASRGNGARHGALDAARGSERVWKPCAVRSGRRLAEAHISCSSPKTFAMRGVEGWFDSLLEACGELRTHSDAYGYTRVLCGGIDAMIDPIVAAYDVAALQILFDETPGAAYSTLHGHRGAARHRFGSAIGAASAALAEEIQCHYRMSVRDLARTADALPDQGDFAEEHVLTASTRPFSKTPPASQRWLLALEAGVAQFRDAHPKLHAHIEDVSIILSANTHVSAVIRNGALDSAPHFEDASGFQIRAVVAGGTGLVTSALPIQESRTSLVFRALQMAYEQSLEQKCGPDTEILAYRDQVIGHFGDAAWGSEPDPVIFNQLVARARTQQLARKADEIQTLQTRVGLGAENRIQLFLDGAQQTITAIASRVGVNATAVRDEEKRRGTYRLHENALLDAEAFDALHAQCLTVAQEHARASLDAAYTPEDVDYDYLAIDADLLGLILHEALGHAAEGDLIQTGASGFGENGRPKALQVAPDWIDIVVDGNLDNCGQSMVDAEGTLALRKAIVRDGVLVDAIHTRQTARAAGNAPDGCARMESVFHPSLNRMTSIWVQARGIVPLETTRPGESIAMPHPETLTRAMERAGYLDGPGGVLFLSGWKGGTASCSNLEFRADVGRVFKLRKGRAPELLREANFTGIATECFRSAVAAFGPVLCRSIGTCGKDGQGVPTSDGGPAILLMRRNSKVRVIGSGEAEEE